MKDRDFVLKQWPQERTVARVACETFVRRSHFFKLSFGQHEPTCSLRCHHVGSIIRTLNDKGCQLIFSATINL